MKSNKKAANKPVTQPAQKNPQQNAPGAFGKKPATAGVNQPAATGTPHKKSASSCC